MPFEYVWRNQEANFGKPVEKEVNGGTHITIEIVLRKDDKFIALRRECIPGHETPSNIEKHPKGLLFFCHNLIRYGESIEKCVKRIVKEQARVNVVKFSVVDIETVVMEESGGKKVKQWAFVPYVIADIDEIPKEGVCGNEVFEVVVFDKSNIPNDFAWWKKKEVMEFFR